MTRAFTLRLPVRVDHRLLGRVVYGIDTLHAGSTADEIIDAVTDRLARRGLGGAQHRYRRAARDAARTGNGHVLATDLRRCRRLAYRAWPRTATAVDLEHVPLPVTADQPA